MTAPRFIHDIWSEHRGSTAATDRNVLRLQRIGAVPAGKRGGNALLLWTPEPHINMLLATALGETGSDLGLLLEVWKNASLVQHQRLYATDFAYHAAAEGEAFGRLDTRGQFEAVRGLANYVREWDADFYEEKGMYFLASERRNAGSPDRILPGATLGEALIGLVDRLTSPSGHDLSEAMLHDAFHVDLMWGGDQQAVATVRYRGALLRNDTWYQMTWCGVYTVARTVQQQLDQAKLFRAPFRTTRSISAVIFLQMADAWSKTKAALAAADTASSSEPPASGSAGGSESETPAPGRAGASKVPTDPDCAEHPENYRNPLGSGLKGRSMGWESASAEREGRLCSPQPRSSHVRDHAQLELA